MGTELPKTLTLPEFQSHDCGQGRDKEEFRRTGSVKATPPSASDEPGGGWQRLKHWCLWFLAFFGIYASSSVCPFCGTPGCPVGAGGATVVGALGALLWRFGTDIIKGGARRVVRYLREVAYVIGKN